MTGERIYSLDHKRVWVAGHRGMVGQALLRRLNGTGAQVLTVDRSQLNLRDQAAVAVWVKRTPASSHVIAALLRKVHEAKESNSDTVELWGTGRPCREFLYVDDAADGLVFLMEHYSDENIVNVAGGEVVSIAELAEIVSKVVGYRGVFHFNAGKPDGMPRKVLDASRIRAVGWRPKISLRDGLSNTYEWFCSTLAVETTAQLH